MTNFEYNINMEEKNKGELCNAFVINNNSKSSYFAFEIITMREIEDFDGGTEIKHIESKEEYHLYEEISLDEPFYRVMALYREESKKSRVLAEFHDVKDAVLFLEELTGLPAYIYSY